MRKIQRKIDSKIGPLYLVVTSKALHGVFWREQNSISYEDENSHAESKMLDKVVMQINEYLSGTRKKFDLILELEGTEFQKRVWTELQRIPYGKTCSYKDLAKKLNDQNASRAVGTANGKNPISLIVPCHRVIASDGTLGGYAGGLEIKHKLLSLEKINN
ncbi:MAG: methylated-DNA--[protein]-cysteine S-methyltransferase [Pseudobdellovibrio sp.]